MSTFPTSLVEATEPLNETSLDEAGRHALQLIDDKGFVVHAGLTLPYANALMAMTLEPAIREYCPNDSGQRFANLEAIKNWLAKGRALYLLLRKDGDDLRLAGYGWMGTATTAEVPEGEVTFALRIGEIAQGQGLATPFSQAIISAAVTSYNVKNIWLETWASNGAAVHVYHKLGFVDVTEISGERLTTSGEAVADRRIFMALPNEAR